MNTPNASVISSVFIAFQDNEEARPVVDAILQDNPNASAVRSPGLVKIVYILQVVGAVGSWLLWLLAAFGASRFDGGAAVGLLVLLVGWIPVLLSIAFTRFVLEGIVALIRIHDRVTEMAERDKAS